MPILDMARQFRELGRLRMGVQVPTRNGKTRPEKLKTWRLTSPRADLLERAASVYGGTVIPWPEAPDGDEFQIITETDELDMIVPPGEPLDQWNELWAGAGCLRRCDSRIDKISGDACPCKREYPDLALRTEAAGKGAACKPTTRVQVILPRLPDVGTWLLVSHSYYAAVELAGTMELLMAARDAGRLIEARLWIDQRTVKRPGQPTKHFPVAAIRIPETFLELRDGRTDAPQLDAPRERLALPAGPALPEDPSFGSEPVEGEIVEPDAATEAALAAAWTPPAATQEPTCGWRLERKDKSVEPCALPEMHPGPHSWHEAAIREGGRVQRPESEAVTA